MANRSAASKNAFGVAAMRRCVPAAAAIGLLVVALRVLNAPFFSFNYLRIVGSVAWAKGFPIYRAGDTDALIAGLNGPFMALVYLPGALASTPDGAVYFGSIVSGLCFFLPFAWLHWGLAHQATKEVAWCAGVISCLLSLTLPPLVLSSSIIHADAPALGFAMAACLSLWFTKDRYRYPLSAFFVAASIFSKMTLLPLLIVLPLYVGLVRGRKAFFEMLGWQIGIGVVVSAVLALLFGVNGVIYAVNAAASLKSQWIGSLSNPNGPPAEGLAARAKILIAIADQVARNFSFLPLSIAFFAVLGFVASEKTAGVETLKRFFSRPWSLFVLASLLCLPPALMARVKFGGADNTLSPFLYFAVAALTSLLQEMAEGAADVFLRKSARAFLIVCLVTFSLLNLHWLYELTWPLRTYGESATSLSARYLARHPGEVYFPEQPLAHLQVEGKLYHSWPTVSEYASAWNRISVEQFRGASPAEAKRVVFFFPPDESVRALYFSDFVPAESIPELPGALVYRRK